MNEKKKIIGYITLRIRKNWTEVTSLAVSSSARGYGIGRQLMERMMDLANAYETNIKLHVSVFNNAAMALYKSLGFVPSKWILDYYQREEEDAIEMYIVRK